jgi:hypothetical protein
LFKRSPVVRLAFVVGRIQGSGIGQNGVLHFFAPAR